MEMSSNTVSFRQLDQEVVHGSQSGLDFFHPFVSMKSASSYSCLPLCLPEGCPRFLGQHQTGEKTKSLNTVLDLHSNWTNLGHIPKPITMDGNDIMLLA